MGKMMPQWIVETTFLKQLDTTLEGGWLYKMEVAELPGTDLSALVFVYARGPQHAKELEAGTGQPGLFQIFAEPEDMIAIGEGLISRGQKAIATRASAARH